MSWSLNPGHTETPWLSQDLNAMVFDPPALSLTTTLDPLGVGPSQLPTFSELSQAGFRDAVAILVHPLKTLWITYSYANLPKRNLRLGEVK